MSKLKKQIRKQTLHELVVLPEREERSTSKEFIESKKRLKKDGHWKCWICNSEEHLEVHHYGCEYSLRDDCLFDKLKEYCELFDVYGYGKLLKDTPLNSVDDIRNCMVLCREHHLSSDSDGVANGIHNITDPIWISQKICKNTVPDNTEELEKIIEN